jgi:hypothetical protein
MEKPQEEPKQEFLEKISSIDLSPEFQQLISDNWDDLTSYEPKHETLELPKEIDFANEIEQISEYDKGRWYGRIEGAKWQEQRSQEAINKLISIIEWYDNESDVRPDAETFMWFEQVKKKQNEKDFN